jgi:6-phosphogluconolactonase (cycloisomerase 2 family)
MHALKISLFLVSIFLVIAGCSGLNIQPNQPQQVSQAPEFLYVGTSKPGLLTFQVQPGGSLKAVPTSASVPDSVCSAALSAAPSKIYSLSQLCPFSADPMELRRFDLGPSGDIISGAGPFSLGPNLPSDIGHIFSFITVPQGNFAYAWTFDNGRESITPIRLDAGGNMTPMPDLGISWPIESITIVPCAFHSPERVITTTEGTFLVVISSRDCSDIEAPSGSYLFFHLDSETGAIGSLISEIQLGHLPQFVSTTQSGNLVVLAEYVPEAPGNLMLFRAGADGVTLLQQCQSNQRACAHPEVAAFHPSGKWLFIADTDTNGIDHGIWTIPIVHGSLIAAKASFISMPDEGYKFDFSSDGKGLYVGQWVDNQVSGQISGFRVDDRTGVLSEMPDSPWNLGTEFFITSMVHTAATGK